MEIEWDNRHVKDVFLLKNGKYHNDLSFLVKRIKSRDRLAYEHLIFCPEEQTTEVMVFSCEEDMIDVT